MKIKPTINLLRQHFKINWYLYVFFLLFVFIYTIHLDSISYAVHGDEANIALQAMQIIPKHMGIIGVGWASLPLLSFLPHTLTLAIFGPTIIGQRMGSVIFGIFSLVVLYLLV